ncbi:MAG: ATP/GTP-binding protein [Thaumarchaeota archaeon]|nr:ATP/GTP-binding protein [Nitrososphaerota archaeon]
MFVAGTAGSGKSLLTDSVIQWYRDKGRDVASVNLDPGVINLPYEPDVDIREFVDLETIMNSYSLGPNGALILATDLVASRLAEVQDKIDETNSDFVVIDTPGQIELFTFRESGPFIAKSLKGESKVLLYLIDVMAASSPANFISLALLSAAVQLRMNLPQIPVLSKIDLAKQATREVIRWSKDPALFEETLSKLKSGEEYALYSQLFRALRRISFSVGLLPVSSLTRDGFIALLGEISRISEAGEETQD